MGSHHTARILFLLAGTLTLTACDAPPPASTAAVPPTAHSEVITPEPPPQEALAVAQTAVADAVLPVVVAAQALLEPAVPEELPTPAVHPKAVALLLKLEVSSAAYYSARLAWPIYPGGASGVTWCIGYDGGPHTALEIGRDWEGHPHVTRLQTTSGKFGADAKAMVPGLRDVVTPFPTCEAVFAMVTLPDYERATARLFSKGWSGMPWLVRSVVVTVIYNRGTSTFGEGRVGHRMLRDECFPKGDVDCVIAAVTEMRDYLGQRAAPDVRKGLVSAYDQRLALIREAKKELQP